jgi:hypothetical protein
MKNLSEEEMKKHIRDKIGMDLEDYAKLDDGVEPHERDNVVSPLDKLTLEELLFIREHNYSLR